MLSPPLPIPDSPAIGSSLLQAIVCDGLASDAALAGLGSGLAAVRLVFAAREGTRGCLGHQPAFIAVDPDDPTLPDRERRELGSLGPGHAVPGCELQTLADGVVALPGRSVAIGAPKDLGAGLERAVVLTLGDAAVGIVHAGARDAFTPRTVVIVRGPAVPRSPWCAAGTAVERVPLSAGVPAPTAHPAAA